MAATYTKVTTGSLVTTGAGDDIIDAIDSIDAKISAGNGINLVRTGKGNDNITSGDGDDFIDAGKGNNTITALSRHMQYSKDRQINFYNEAIFG